MDELTVTTETVQLGGESVTVVAPDGFLDSYTVPQFMRLLEDIIDGGALHVVLDMTGLEYMSSAGFGVLAGANRHLLDHDGRMVIACLSDRLKGIFDNLGLSAIVPVAADRQEAIDSFRTD